MQVCQAVVARKDCQTTVQVGGVLLLVDVQGFQYWTQPEDRKDCEFVYIGETSRTIEKCLSEHKNAVKKHDSNNVIAAHVWTNQHQADWKAAKTREMEGD